MISLMYLSLTSRAAAQRDTYHCFVTLRNVICIKSTKSWPVVVLENVYCLLYILSVYLLSLLTWNKLASSSQCLLVVSFISKTCCNLKVLKLETLEYSSDIIDHHYQCCQLTELWSLVTMSLSCSPWRLCFSLNLFVGWLFDVCLSVSRITQKIKNFHEMFRSDRL